MTAHNASQAACTPATATIGGGAGNRSGRAYYNEFDPKAAAWLRELIAAGLIMEGDVDERSIREVSPWFKGYTRCHFFGGVAGWDYALRLAGWPADRPVWTGSCPCQPFSSAGKRKGRADARHLWPVWFRLIAECRPPVVFGEQVASKDGREWFSGVQSSLESVGYRVGAADLCAAGVGAPHIRQRLYWVADADGAGGKWTGDRGAFCGPESQGTRTVESGERGGFGGMAYANGGDSGAERQQRGGEHGQQPQDGGVAGGLDDAPSERAIYARQEVAGSHGADNGISWSPGHWDDYDLIPCRDGKARRVEPGVAPLVAGLPRGVVCSGDPGAPGYANQTAEGRLMRLRGYGNSIVPQVAAEFIRAYMDCRGNAAGRTTNAAQPQNRSNE